VIFGLSQYMISIVKLGYYVGLGGKLGRMTNARALISQIKMGAGQAIDINIISRPAAEIIFIIAGQVIIYRRSDQQYESFPGQSDASLNPSN
jgi:hypothetical protein